MEKLTGGFTLPGESGYEDLTLALAKKWGADVIRDSDGTELSKEILDAGYGIYSTLCIIRDHNEWAKQNRNCLQQTFLMSDPVSAADTSLEISLLDGYFKEQFEINDSADSLPWWQVFDRTADKEITDWHYKDGRVYIENAVPWHRYTVNFLAYRIWEEISMYNHITNNWDKEHLMQIDPRYPETQEYLNVWLKNWCEKHKATTVVRFTSMFYNFVWIWGADERNRNRFTDWASYDFTVSPLALKQFEEKYGYKITSENFINKGKLNVTHMPADKAKLDWMEFIGDFVTDYGKQLVDIVHDFGKKAYVFYDDSWVGVEPWSKRFEKFGFDGLIKCVFNGFEVRLCGGVEGVDTHEIRLHPYLFPVGLGGAPTFSEGGNPKRDAQNYWKNVRRAMLRKKIERIGLGGYLSLTLPFPEFNDYIEQIADEFRTIRELHSSGAPYVWAPKIAVLSFWGSLRSWTCSGHYHENPWNDLINIVESLSGLPFDVDFISFDEISSEKLSEYDVVINAGFEGSAWSGGAAWDNAETVSLLTEWAYNGGVFIGVNEPCMTRNGDLEFKLSHILGINEDTGSHINHGKFSFTETENDFSIDRDSFPIKDSLYLTDPDTRVLLAKENAPCITEHKFGKGWGLYLSGYRFSAENTFFLAKFILSACGIEKQLYMTDNCYCECAYFPQSKKLIVINSSDKEQSTTIQTEAGAKTFTLSAFGMTVEDICRN